MRRLICTPAVVGMLHERGEDVVTIAKRVKRSVSLVREYLKFWQQASERDRAIARSGIVLGPR
jgi:hypothetical protein